METTEKKEVIISYWNQNTKLYPTYSKLWDANIPDSGEASTNDGESIRAIGRLMYEWCNNGNCNALEIASESCSECGGMGYEEADECSACDGSGKDGEEDECSYCDGSGEEEANDCSYCNGECSVDGERSVSEMYNDFLNHIDNNVPNSSNEVEAVREMITSDKNYNYNYDQAEYDIYNALADKVVEHVMKNSRNFDVTNKEKKDEKVEVIKEGYRKTTEEEVEALEYLNKLKNSGRTNMFGARPYLIKEMGLEKKQAGEVMKLWIANFNEQGNYTQVKI